MTVMNVADHLHGGDHVFDYLPETLLISFPEILICFKFGSGQIIFISHYRDYRLAAVESHLENFGRIHESRTVWPIHTGRDGLDTAAYQIIPRRCDINADAREAGDDNVIVKNLDHVSAISHHLGQCFDEGLRCFRMQANGQVGAYEP